MKELNKQNLRKQEWTQWEINMKTFKEARGDTAVFTFGRFNPPTTGHEKLINALAKQVWSTNVCVSITFTEPEERPTSSQQEGRIYEKDVPTI